MKTKNRVLAVAEIAIVLCSVFLMVLPGIAAEQTTQEVSASTITTSSEDDCVLGVYGNANEDDTIDMRDLTYVKLIFFGKKPDTELADAKYDGKINPLDFIQIKLIIVGKEKELTIVDSADRRVTVKKPIERIVVLHMNPAGLIQVLNARDKVVGVGTGLTQRKLNYPELSKLPSVGTWSHTDYETILNLNPDLVLAFLMDRPSVPCMEHLPDSIPVVGLNVNKVKTMSEEFKKMGYILDKKDEAKEFINFYNGYIDEMNERTEGFSEDEKLRVFFSFSGRYTTETTELGGDIAGGKNIAADLPGGRFPTVDPEWVIEQNPDIIIVGGWGTPGGYNTDDPSEMKDLRESVINRPELAYVNAVKNGRVYAVHIETHVGPDGIMGMIYYAKWFHPDIFKDWDPQAIHQEYLERFKRIDFNVYEHGVFVYHPEEHPDGK